MNILKITLLLVGVALSRLALAGCDTLAPTLAMPESHIQFGKITVDSTLPVGGVIASISQPQNGEVGCVWSAEKWRSPGVGGEGVYQTNLKGVGIRMTQGGKVISTTARSPDAAIPGPLKIELIKTGEISGGVLENGIIAEQKTREAEPVRSLKLSGVNALAAATCTVTTPDVNVNLGFHRPGEFAENTVTAWQKFAIGLDCVQGTIVSVQFDFSIAPGRLVSTMPLDDAGSSSTAQGVGVQMFFADDTRIYPGEIVQDYLTSTNGGTEYINLKARYVQISTPVTAGKADATATFTMTYR
ncbi:fimbrial protein [Enterobacter sp. E-TC7]|uniref:Fimbrial protein n=1 Tax=Enterobacter nematophilus TaxID=2994648 RepID=A0ABT3VTW1_9ENTR|nr:fimbrial protein [Enterobacter nematophilus]MCX5573199.1 fimbrial protein [Enterobacter nematophilus]